MAAVCRLSLKWYDSSEGCIVRHDENRLKVAIFGETSNLIVISLIYFFRVSEDIFNGANV